MAIAGFGFRIIIMSNYADRGRCYQPQGGMDSCFAIVPCHCPGDMFVRMPKILAIPRSSTVRVGTCSSVLISEGVAASQIYIILYVIRKLDPITVLLFMQNYVKFLSS